MTPTAELTETSEATPIIVDLGRKKRRDIKDLCNGAGALLDEVVNCVKELKVSGTIAPGAQPVVVIVREKRKRTFVLPGL